MVGLGEPEATMLMRRFFLKFLMFARAPRAYWEGIRLIEERLGLLADRDARRSRVRSSIPECGRAAPLGAQPIAARERQLQSGPL